MTLELLNSLATLGTFLVISATAIAAIVQLRHARGSNQIALLTEFRDAIHTAQFLDAQVFVETELRNALEDPALRHQLLNRSARTTQGQLLITKINTIGNHYETMGQFVKSGLVDRNFVLETWFDHITSYWEKLAPVAAIFRRNQGNSVWENFEYLAVLSQDWDASHPHGSYPKRVRRLELPDDYKYADEQYASSLAAVT